MSAKTIIVACWLTAIAGAFAQDQCNGCGLTYACRTACAPVTIDGVLDEAAWLLADRLPIEYVLQPQEYLTAPPRGSVRILWDAQFLYVGFECSDDDVWSFSSKDDEMLCTGDVVELFLKPSREANVYYEFNIAPNGALFDARYPSRGAGGVERGKAWSSGAQIATRVDGTDGDDQDFDKGYCVEMKIPWASFREGAPAPDAIWTFGAFRFDYSKSFESPFLLKSISAPMKRFHDYEFYQDIQFIRPDTSDSSRQK